MKKQEITCTWENWWFIEATIFSGKIISILGQAEIALVQGMTIVQVCRQPGIALQVYYQWRKQYGGMDVSQAIWMLRFQAKPAPTKKKARRFD